MNKILHISKYYYPFVGGVEQTARDVVNALKDKYQQKVICFNHEDGEVEDIVDDVEVYRCKCQSKISSQSISLSYGSRLRIIINNFQPNYIIFHYPNPYVSHYLLKVIRPQCKLVLYWHLDITKQKILGKVFHPQNLNLIKRADKIIATSPNYIEGSTYLSTVKDKCIVIPSCINEQRLKVTDNALSIKNKILHENKGKIICLAVGRHVEYKGFEYLIEASKKLDSRFVIFITGSGERTRHLKDIASDDDKIHFLGLVDDDTLKAFYLATDIFCFPSITKNEAFGLALTEAMYFGNPAVTFTIPGSGVNYVSLDRVTGIEVANRNVDKYAFALEQLAADKELRSRYGRDATKRVINNFLYDSYIKNIRRLFREI